ncbi:MAG TPA: lipoprotein ABC transporter permease [Pseudoclavibacter sp.]|nr:lipoprotein ABC transporter permease [Pseudoclavibacter sp.]
MKAWSWARVLLREAVWAAISQPIVSLAALVMIAGMCATVMLTNGRTNAAQQDVLSTIDQVGTRSIIVELQDGAGVDTSVLTRIENLESIAWSGAFSAATDTHNQALGNSGTNVAIRTLWTSDPEELGIAETSPVDNAVWATPVAAKDLGLQVAAGAILTNDGISYSVVGTIDAPSYLDSYEPLLVYPQTIPETAQTVNSLIVIADQADQVASLATTITSLLGAEDSTKVSVTTSARLAELRGLVEGQLTGSNTSLIVLVFALTAVLVAVILYTLVVLRRKDFGRRRALGSTRSTIVLLLLIQTGITAIVGAFIGCAAALCYLAITGDPLPSVTFVVATGILAILIALTAALIPAIVASRRDPIRELRVP